MFDVQGTCLDAYPTRFVRSPEGGRVLPGMKDDPTAPYFGWRDYPGDWVWSYERLVPEEEK